MFIKTTIKDIDLLFDTNERCFSPIRIDNGTIAMLSKLEIEAGMKVLDLGCGYGVVGILAAHFTQPELVFMVDVDTNAVEISRTNAEKNGVSGVNIVKSDAFDNLVETGFDLIISNPPYHTDFSVAKSFIEKGFNRLNVGGTMFMVTKRLEWYKNKITSIFGGVMVYPIGGYYVFKAIKKQRNYAKS